MPQFEANRGSIAVDPKYPMVRSGVLSGGERLGIALGIVKCEMERGRNIEVDPPQAGHVPGVALEFTTRVEKAYVRIELSREDARRLMHGIAECTSDQA